MENTTQVTTAFNFIPADYVAPVTNSDNLKMPADGESIRFAVLGQLVSGWLYWTEAKVCHRKATMFEDTPGMREGDKQKHFWLLHCVNLDDGTIQKLEITQSTVQKDILGLFESGDYCYTDGSNGFRISRKGKTMQDTKYTVAPTPIKPAEKASYAEALATELPDLAKYAFEVRAPKTDITETVTDVM